MTSIIVRIDTAPLPSMQAVARIQHIVAEAYGLDPRVMRAPARGRSVSWPRQVAMYLTRKTTANSLPNIGHLFGDRDHTTVMWAIHAVEHRMETIPFYRDDVEELRERLSQ